MNRIPPVREALTALRNPAIERALTELRKVVNAMVREYGKPAELRIELVRDLKKSRKVRETITKGARQNEDKRREAAKKILAECGIKMELRDRGIEKALLWIDQDGVCPYTGESTRSQVYSPRTTPTRLTILSPFADSGRLLPKQGSMCGFGQPMEEEQDTTRSIRR